MDTVAKSEQVEGELSAFISKRDKQRRKEEGDRPAEEMYAASTRRHLEKQQRQQWWEHLRFHEAMMVAHTRNLEVLISQHREAAAKYAGLLGVEMLDESAKRNGYKRGAA